VAERYGPNSVAAERLLGDLDVLHPGAIAALAAAGGGSFGTAEDDPDVAARAELRSRLRSVAERSRRMGAIRAIGEEIEAWASSTTHWFPAGVAGAGESTAEIGPRLAAVPVVLDAAYAVVLEDLLEDEELDLLLAPWEEVVGSPFGDRPGEADGPAPRDDAEPDWDDAGADDGDDDRLPGSEEHRGA
jgi:hypothetical protein